MKPELSPRFLSSRRLRTKLPLGLALASCSQDGWPCTPAPEGQSPSISTTSRQAAELLQAPDLHPCHRLSQRAHEGPSPPSSLSLHGCSQRSQAPAPPSLSLPPCLMPRTPAVAPKAKPTTKLTQSSHSSHHLFSPLPLFLSATGRGTKAFHRHSPGTTLQTLAMISTGSRAFESWISMRSSGTRSVVASSGIPPRPSPTHGVPELSLVTSVPDGSSVPSPSLQQAPMQAAGTQGKLSTASSRKLVSASELLVQLKKLIASGRLTKVKNSYNLPAVRPRALAKLLTRSS